MWSCEVPVGAGDAVSDELLLQRRERVPLQHLQPVQQLWRQMFITHLQQQTRATAAAGAPVLRFGARKRFIISDSHFGNRSQSGGAQRSVT